MTGRRAARLGMLAATLLVGGCGSSTGPAPTHAQFASRANAICASGLKSAARIKPPKSRAGLLSFSEQASSLVSTLFSQLKTLRTPSSSRLAYNEFLTTVGHEAQLLS